MISFKATGSQGSKSGLNLSGRKSMPDSNTYSAKAKYSDNKDEIGFESPIAMLSVTFCFNNLQNKQHDHSDNAQFGGEAGF